MSFSTEALRKDHDRKNFNCGNDALDAYIRQFAFQDIKRRLAGCFVALDSLGRIAGFYTLTATSISLESLPPDIGRKLPRYPVVPAVLLGRLAVSLDHRKRGLGRSLIADAIYRIEQSGIGAFAIVADAKDEAAKTFYLCVGFTPDPDAPMRLFLPLAERLAINSKS